MWVPSRVAGRGTWPGPHEAAGLPHSAAAVLAAERSVEVHAAAVGCAVVPDQVQTLARYASYTVAVHMPPLAGPAAFGSEDSGRHIAAAAAVAVAAYAAVAYFGSSFAAADGVDLGPWCNPSVDPSWAPLAPS